MSQLRAGDGRRRPRVTKRWAQPLDVLARLLKVAGDVARWFHLDFAAPGRLGFKNNPTFINGTKWFPTWPHPGENRFCHCHSSTFRKVMPQVPRQAVGVFIKAVRCRDSCSARYRDGVLVIDFNDDPTAGDAWYGVRVTLTLTVAEGKNPPR